MAFLLSASLKIMNLKLLYPERLFDYKRLVDAVGLLIGEDKYFNSLIRDCRHKRAFLFGSSEAFFVLRMLPGMTMFIDIGCTTQAVNRGAYMSDLMVLAESVEAKAIEFLSARSGFQRVAPKFGFICVNKKYNGKNISLWRKDL